MSPCLSQSPACTLLERSEDEGHGAAAEDEDVLLALEEGLAAVAGGVLDVVAGEDLGGGLAELLHGEALADASVLA